MNKLKNLFICIGAQKSATSWLHKVLSSDGRLKMPHFIKEVHYFSWVSKTDNLINKWRDRWKKELINSPDTCKLLNLATSELNNNWYVDFMELESGKICAVDITPEYAAMRVEGFNCIKDVADKFKLLFVLRDPVDRSWSAILHWYKNQHTIEDLKSKSVAGLLRLAKSNLVNCRSDYLSTLKTLNEAKVSHLNKIMFYDELLKDSDSFIKQIYNHMEVDPPNFENNILDNKIHVSPKIKPPEEFNSEMTKFYKPMVRKLNKRIIIPDAWKAKYQI
jgi:hypothetical protein